MKSAFKFLFGAFIAIILLVRISGLNLNVYTDETVFALEAKDGFENFGKIISEHPPIPIFLYSLYGSLFGNSNVALRLVPVTFAALSLIMVYFLAKTLYDKKTAVVSVSLMAVSFWHTLASLQIDIDGALLTFTFLAAFFCYTRYLHTNKSKWLLFSGLFFGLALLTKLPAILIIPIILLYHCTLKRHFRDTIKSLGIIVIIGIIIFLLFSIFSYTYNQEYFKNVFLHGKGSAKFKISLLPIVYVLIWGTPLLVFIPLLSLRQFKKEDLFLVIWCLIPVIFYLFFGIPYLAPFERYLMIIIPPLSILAGKYIAYRFEKKYFLLVLSSLIISFAIILFLNINTNYLPHNVQNYISNAKSLMWNFYFPITGASGPMFGINFSSLAIAYIISLILIFLSIKGKYKIHFFHIFIALAVALNLFMAQEFIFHTIHPNFNSAIPDVGNYFLENKLPLPIYTNQLSYLYYFDIGDGNIQSSRESEKFFWLAYNVDEQNLNMLEKRITAKKGTILVVDFPIIDKNSRLWQIINKCQNRKIFYSKNFPVGYVFDCK